MTMKSALTPGLSDPGPEATPTDGRDAKPDPRLPVCRICGYTDHWLGEHLGEAHGLSVDTYLRAFPGTPTISEECLNLWRDSQPKNLRREHPPEDTDLTVSLLGKYPLRVNADVPPEACLTLPRNYRFPTHGDLAVDIQEALIALLSGRHLYIHGLPGTGKDALIHAISYLGRRPCILRQVSPTTDVEAWLYVRSFDQQGTRYETHELFHGLTEGYFCPSTGRRVPFTILLSDFDRATKSQAEFLRLIIDSILGRVMGPGGVVYPVFPGTQIVCTANTAGGGDTTGRMVSANVIDGSIFNRLARKLKFHWMEWQDEEPIIKAEFPLLVSECPGAISQVGLATTSLRDAIHKRQLYVEFSHRDVCAVLEHMQDVIRWDGAVPTDLVKRGFRVWLDGCPDEETRLAAERLIDPHIRGGVVGTSTDSGSPGGLAGF